MAIPKRLSLLLLTAVFAASLAGCGDTWHGVKKDTGENLEKSGRAIERAGEKVKP